MAGHTAAESNESSAVQKCLTGPKSFGSPSRDPLTGGEARKGAAESTCRSVTAGTAGRVARGPQKLILLERTTIYIKQRATVPPGCPDMSKHALEEVVRSGRSHRRAIRETQLREPVRCGRTVTGGLRDFSIRLGHPRVSADRCCRLQRLTPLLY
ncbi:hypothetical protein NDU88_005376 [Pleurodeles waltl]|uniref:Uncharacterized protein n=1 Tax=Pleurodeles waltl TaxID=8319 RepID=A0AAV7NNV0_PLEWA|nr:hypothetical protein NDU88_005376 [Pleurodeles waltl]